MYYLRAVIIVIILALWHKPFNSFAQTENKEKCTYYFIKAWGFLKYYHNNVAKGEVNWNNVFYEGYLKIQSGIYNTDSLLTFLLEKAGNIENSSKENNDLPNEIIRWMTDSGFISASVANRYKIVYHTYKPCYNYYVGNKISNKLFTNESAITDESFPSSEKRMLALARYWNIIEYYFYSKYLLQSNWDSVLVKHIPLIRNTSNAREYQESILMLTAEINDVHARTGSSCIDNDIIPVFYYSNFEVRKIQNEFVVTKRYCETEDSTSFPQVGDIVRKVEYEPISIALSRILPYLSSPDSDYKIHQAGNDVLHLGKEKTINIGYTRKGKDFTIDYQRMGPDEFLSCEKKQINENNVSFLTQNIAYVDMRDVKYFDLHKLFKEVKTTKAVIFDLRCYPNNFVLYKLPKYLSPVKLHRSQWVVENIPSLKNPGQKEYEKVMKRSGKNRKYYKGIVVVLVDETTLSIAEWTCMAFQTSPNAIIIGTRTAGATGGVVYVKLPSGITTSFSFTGAFYPDGRPTQIQGIVPDIKLDLKKEDYQNGRDAFIDKAVEYLNSKGIY